MFTTITDWVSSKITEPLTNLIIDTVNTYVVKMLSDLVDLITVVFANEVKLARFLIDNQYITEAVEYSIGIALMFLVVRISFNALNTYIAFSSGEEAHPGELIKDAAKSAILIVSIPWIVKQALYFSFSIMDDILGLQAIPAVETLGEGLISFIFTASGILIVPIALMLIFGLLLWIIVLIQMAVRAVNIALLMVVGPWMWAFKSSLGEVWFKALLGQCFAIPIQIFMLRGAIGVFLSATVTGLDGVVLSTLLFIGFLWATIKFPAFLQQLVAQSGVGAGVGGAVRSVGQGVAMRVILRR